MITSYQTAGSPLARKAQWPSIDTSHTVQQGNKKRHARSLQGHCDICIHTEVRQRAVTLPDCFKSGCSNISTSYSVQLPRHWECSWCVGHCQLQGSQLTLACLCALMHCHLPCWNMEFAEADLLGGPRLAETLAVQVKVLFIWPNLKPTVKECSEKFYSHIKFYKFVVCIGHNIWGERSREGKSKINYNEFWNAARYITYKENHLCQTNFLGTVFSWKSTGSFDHLYWEGWDLYYFKIKLGRRV